MIKNETTQTTNTEGEAMKVATFNDGEFWQVGSEIYWVFGEFPLDVDTGHPVGLREFCPDWQWASQVANNEWIKVS